MGSSRRLTTWLLLWMLLLPADTAIALAGPRAPAPHVDVEMLAPDIGAAAPSCDVPGVNTVFCENQLPGVGPDVWDLATPGAGDPAIQGFATDISVNLGETIQFKIDSTTSDYRIDIYRLGYYQGLGARHMGTVTPTAGVAPEQPNCLTAPETGLIDCGNWRVSAAWTVPPLAVSGVYLAKLVQNLTGAASHIVFIVRDDNGGSDLLFQTSDTTWQAYNDYAGNSLYRGLPAGRAYKVSYNRPLVTRGDPGSGQATALFNAEYPMIRWLEANGYDVSYTSGVDTDRRGGELLEHTVFLSVGHDEYWSGAQRANVEAARDAGVHLAFFSGNEVFWKTRWETSIDGSGTPHRTLVCYKETHANAKIDPSPEWTGTWRDPRFSPPADGGRPENALSGTLFSVNGTRSDSIKVPAAFAPHRFWRNTSLALLQSGQTAVLPAGTLGYEWDEAPEDSFRPLGLQRLSSTTLDVSPLYLQDYGNTYGDGTATHSLTLYRAPSGALVFSAGTVQWSWGLDSHHDRGAEPPSPDMQQATVNLLADMGVHSPALQPGLMSGAEVADLSAPVSTITAPPSGAVVRSGDPIVISGTASDDQALAGIDVSVDGGATWMRAAGLQDWTLSWTPGASGPVTIQSRAFDDSGNMQATPATAAITVTRDCPCSIWDASAVPPVPVNDDPNATEVGVRFRAEIDGVITGIRFYKGTGNDGTHTGSLWTPEGALLASAVFTNETATGWQQVDFATPVQVTANATYIASYHAPLGRYAIERPSATTPLAGFAQSVNNPPVRALADNEDGSNGLFVYSSSPAFPNQSFGSTNYFVDVVFVPTVSADEGPPFVTERTPLDGATGVTTFTDVTARFNRALDPASVTPDTVELRGPAGVVAGTIAYLAATRTIVLDPTLALDENTTYIVTLRGGPTGIRDLSGVPLDVDVSWTFTTAAPVVCPCTIWPETAVPVQVIDNIDDTLAAQQGIELGVRFRADHDGVITGIRFYKSEANVGPHAGTLWTSAGTELATATLAGGTSSGWQQMTFGSPVQIVADQTYVASYHAPAGRYSVDPGYFTSAASPNFTRPPLRALVDGVDGLNGVFRYGPRAFPTESFNQSNYWVDVVFEPATAADSAPVASSQSVTTLEDTAVSITLTASDAEGAPLTYTIVSAPLHGALSGTAPALTYTPAANYNGSDSFTFTVNDGAAASNVATVSIGITPVNDAPVAADQVVATDEDMPKAITLTGIDVEGSALSYTIVTAPLHGALSGTPPALTYTPAANYNGSDSFTFTVNDGAAASNVATVSISIASIDDAPVAEDQAVATDEDTPKAITLAGSDGEGSALSYTIVTAPLHGALSGTAPALTYTPAANYNGSDSFTFTVNDGAAASNVATVSISIASINDAPVAADQAVATDEDTPKAITLTGIDVEGSALSYTIVTGPLHGALSGTAPALTYTPAANYNGSDSFTFTVNDGATASNVATVTLTINPINDVPVAGADARSTVEDAPLVFLAAELTSNDTDLDGNPLTVTAVTGATTGTVVLTAGSITYTPNPNVNGSDAFTYTVTDGHGGTATGTVTVVIAPANDAPAAVNDSATTTEDSAVDVVVVANDTDIDSANTALRVEAGSILNVRGGTAALLIDGRTVRFTPALNANGGNTTGGFGFTYRVSDGSLVSAHEGAVTVTVAAANDAPAAVNDSATTTEDSAVDVVVVANDTDIDSANTTLRVQAGSILNVRGGAAELLIDGRTVRFTPALNANDGNTTGGFGFTYRVGDGSLASANEGVVTITVAAANDAPVAVSDSYAVDEDGTLGVTAPGVLANDGDVDSDARTAVLVAAPLPTHGSVSLAADGSFTFVPALNFHGTATFSYRTSDGTASSDAVLVVIGVRPVNDAPVAENNSYSVAVGGTLTIGVPGLLGNDRDADGTPPAAAVLESTAAHGTLTLRTDGSFDYTPHLTFAGVDSFSYRANDGVANSAPAVVAIAVGGDAATQTLPEDGASTTISTEDAVAGTTPQDPVSTTVTAPAGMAGTVTIAEAALDPAATAPANYSSVGQQVTISAPEATAANPLVLQFRIDASLLGSVDRNTVRMVRNGSLVGDCAVTGGTVADPDPCESGRNNCSERDNSVLSDSS